MRVLVTGAAGSIGSHLCKRLVEDGHEVMAVDNLSSGRRERIAILESYTDSRFSFYEENFGSFDFVDIDWVFHLAALADIVPSIEQPLKYHNSNVHQTVQLLKRCSDAKIKRFIYAASSSCYGIPDVFPTPETAECRPMYPYALTKYVAEQYVLHWAKVYSLPAISLRLFNVYGPNFRTSGTYGAVFGVFLAQLANNKPLTVVGDGMQSRDFTFVSDVVNAFILAARSQAVGIFNIGSGGHYSINDLCKNLRAKEIEFLPKRPGEPDCTFADITKAREILKYSPHVSLKQGVKIMLGELEKYKTAPLWDAQSIAEATKTWFQQLTV
jgi:UDP-glucose 4-epimerase